MFHVIIPPTRIDFPAVTSGSFHDVELAHAMERESFKTGALWGRLHDNTSTKGITGFKMKLVAFPIWPDEHIGARFSPPQAPTSVPIFEVFTSLVPSAVALIALETDPITKDSQVGELFTRTNGSALVSSTIVVPALHTVARFYAEGGIDFSSAANVLAVIAQRRADLRVYWSNGPRQAGSRASLASTPARDHVVGPVEGRAAHRGWRPGSSQRRARTKRRAPDLGVWDVDVAAD